MSVSFFAAQTDELSCSYENVLLHSRYDPIKEAERFVEHIDCNFSPSCIIVTGASLSYMLPFLQKRFPSIHCYAVQFKNDFAPYSKDWDEVFYCTEKTKKHTLSEEIFYTCGEEELFAGLFLSWKPSEKAFFEEHEKTWNALQLALIKARDVIVTRSYFNKKWSKNTIRFFLQIQKITTITSCTKSIALVASGPSLKDTIPFLKEKKNDLFLVAVSSAIAPLLENNIIPDLIFSTDGGWYAKNHFFPLIRKELYNIPLAISPEAAVPSVLLEKNPIIPLQYGDSLESLFFTKTSIDAISAQRNGTVTGTAIQYLKTFSPYQLFICGMDMCSGKGFSHTAPNELENRDCLSDCRIKPLQTRILPRILKNNSLEIYRNWFASLSKKETHGIFRIVPQNFYLEQIGLLKDISVDKALQYMNKKKDTGNIRFAPIQNVSKNEVHQNVSDCIDSLQSITKNKTFSKKNELLYTVASYPDFLLMQKHPGTIDFREKLIKKTQEFIAMLQKEEKMWSKR